MAKSRAMQAQVLHIILGVCGFIFICVASFGASWAKLTFEGTVRENGLWRRCWEKDNTEKADQGCHSVTAKNHWLKACQTMSVLSVVTSFIGVSLAVACYFNQRVNPLIAPTWLAAAGALMFATLVVFLSECSWINEGGFSYSWSFALGWVGMLVTVAASTAGLVAARL